MHWLGRGKAPALRIRRLISVCRRSRLFVVRSLAQWGSGNASNWVAAVKPRSSTFIASGSSLCQRAVISARRFFALASPGARKTAATSRATRVRRRCGTLAQELLEELRPTVRIPGTTAECYENGSPIAQRKKIAA